MRERFGVLSFVLVAAVVVSPDGARSEMHGRPKRANPRQQANELSSYLDGSVVYGSDETRAAALRTFSGGELATSPGDLPPAPMRDFREFDGSRNSYGHPSWGEAGSALLRNAPAQYADGLSEPAGENRPSAREISNTLCAHEEEGEDSPRNDRSMSDWIYAWGQFVDHDLDLTTTGSTPFDIPVPLGDPFFDPNSTGTQVIALDRSNFDEGTGTMRNLHLFGNRSLRRRQALFE